MTAVFGEESYASQFVNFGTGRPLETQQYTEFTSSSAHANDPGLAASGLELQRALWRTNPQNKLRLLLKCHGTLLYYCIWLQIITPDTNTFKNCNNLGNITLSAHMYKGKEKKRRK